MTVTFSFYTHIQSSLYGSQEKLQTTAVKFSSERREWVSPASWRGRKAFLETDATCSSSAHKESNRALRLCTVLMNDSCISSMKGGSNFFDQIFKGFSFSGQYYFTLPWVQFDQWGMPFGILTVQKRGSPEVRQLTLPRNCLPSTDCW